MTRFKKILKWTAIIAGASIAALLIADAVFIWRTGSRLEDRLDALRRAGEPLQIADLGRKPVPPEQDADEFLRRATRTWRRSRRSSRPRIPAWATPRGR